MTRPLLSDTLIDLIAALDIPEGVEGLALSDAEITLPVEVSLAIRDGVAEFRAAPPVSVWRSGVENPVHRLRVTAVAVPPGPPPSDGEAT